MFPGWLHPVIIFAEDDHRCPVGFHPPAIGGKGPLVGPAINPGGVIFEQPDTTMTGGISRQIKLMKGNSPLVVEIKVPGQQPFRVHATSSSLRFPVGVIESRRRRRGLLSGAGRPPAYEFPELVGAEGLDATRNEEQLRGGARSF